MANVSPMKTYFAGRPTTGLSNAVNNPVNMSNKVSSIHFVPAPTTLSLAAPQKPVGYPIGS